MNESRIHKLARTLIKDDGWMDIIPMFIDVLKINIFIIDAEGRVLLPPKNNKYGERILKDRALGFDIPYNSQEFLQTFIEHGPYLESINYYRLHMYAIPLKAPETNEIVAYFIVGPVVMNKSLGTNEYRILAEENNTNPELLLNELNDVRVVSNITIKLILDLISATAQNNANLNVREQKESFEKVVLHGSLAPHMEVSSDPKVLQQDRKNRILGSFLDTALMLTDTECGSIMILDDERKTLSIKVSRGLDEEKVKDVRILVGEGIAGLSAKENSAFIIGDKVEDNRIKHLLKRPEIKQALVMPLTFNNRVFGVLNLHTKKEESHPGFNVDTLKSLSNLLSFAL